MSRVTLFRFSLGVAMAVAYTQFACAGFLPGVKGNSIFGTGSTTASRNASADGTVSFAVYERTDGDWTDDDFGDGAGALSALIDEQLALGGIVDSAAAFVYFYQVVNNDPLGPEESQLDSFFVNFLSPVANVITGGGFIDGVTFGDGADLTAGANPGLGSDAGPVDSPVGDGVPSAIFAGTPTIAAPTLISGALQPSDAIDVDGNSVEFIFDQVGGSILPGERSFVLFLTSNYGPIWSTGGLTDNGFTEGDIPVPNPEASTFAMTLAALACGLIVVVKGGRNK